MWGHGSFVEEPTCMFAKKKDSSTEIFVLFFAFRKKASAAFIFVLISCFRQQQRSVAYHLIAYTWNCCRQHTSISKSSQIYYVKR